MKYLKYLGFILMMLIASIVGFCLIPFAAILIAPDFLYSMRSALCVPTKK